MKSALREDAFIWSLWDWQSKAYRSKYRIRSEINQYFKIATKELFILNGQSPSDSVYMIEYS
jgi:hypothetical protein